MKKVNKEKEEELLLIAVVVENVLGFTKENKFLGVWKLLYKKDGKPLEFFIPLGFIPTAVIISRKTTWEETRGAAVKIKIRDNKLVAIGHIIEDIWITEEEIKEFYKKLEQQQKNITDKKEVKENVRKDSKGNGGKRISESSGKSNNKVDSKKKKTTSNKQKRQ